MRSAIISLFSSLAIAVMVLAMPVSALAADVPFYYGGLSDPNDPLLPCTGFFQLDQKIKYLDPQNTNPAEPKYIEQNVQFQAVSDIATNNLQQCLSLCNVFDLVNNLLRFAISVLITIFTPIMFIIGGFYILISGGNPGYRATGKKIITGTLTGLAIIICSWLIVSQMMTLIFEQGWGETLRQRLADQINRQNASSTLGVKLEDIPEFSWNTISCTARSGSIEVTTGTTDPEPTTGPGTGGPKVNPTTPGTGPGTGTTDPQASPGTCYAAADMNKYSCALGWKKVNTNICPNADSPYLCRTAAVPGRCYYINPQIQQDADVCAGSWQETAKCSKDANGNEWRECVTSRTNPPATPANCYSAADMNKYSCALGWKKVNTNICPNADWPYLCRAAAVPGRCYYVNPQIEQDADVCSGTWQETAKCSKDANGNPWRECVTSASTQDLRNVSCQTKAYSQSNTCVQSSWTLNDSSCKDLSPNVYGCRFSFDHECEATCKAQTGRSFQWTGTKNGAGKCNCN